MMVFLGENLRIFSANTTSRYISEGYPSPDKAGLEDLRSPVVLSLARYNSLVRCVFDFLIRGKWIQPVCKQSPSLSQLKQPR